VRSTSPWPSTMVADAQDAVDRSVAQRLERDLEALVLRVHVTDQPEPHSRGSCLKVRAQRKRSSAARVSGTFRCTMDDKRKLKGMLARIFSDAKASESERAELKGYLSSGKLSMAEIKEVFEDFVQTTWKITMADGVVSEIERQRLAAIVNVLGLEIESLPAEWVKILQESVLPQA
jgi:hypothetical protein